MKVTQKNVVRSFTHTMAVGVNQAEIDLNLGLSQGILLKSIDVTLDPSSAVPSVTGAGLSLFLMAIARRAQASPTSVKDVSDLIVTAGALSAGSTAAGALAVGIYVKESDVPTMSLPLRKLIFFGQTSNITNAATTVLRVTITYDIVSLTTSDLAQMAD